MTRCAYEDYYCHQAGYGLPVFAGTPTYRGRGLGNVLAGLGRMVLPLLKKGGKALLKEGAQSGLEVVQDALRGRNLKESFKKRAHEAGNRLFQRAAGGAASSLSSAAATPTRKRKSSGGLPRQQIKKKKKKARKGMKNRDIFG